MFSGFSDGSILIHEPRPDLDGHSIGIAVTLNQPKFRRLEMRGKEQGFSVGILIKQGHPSDPRLFGVCTKISGPFWMC